MNYFGDSYVTFLNHNSSSQRKIQNKTKSALIIYERTSAKIFCFFARVLIYDMGTNYDSPDYFQIKAGAIIFISFIFVEKFKFY